jgi:hypothetical protein
MRRMRNPASTIKRLGRALAVASVVLGWPGSGAPATAASGHNPFWEDPQGVADVINRFLAP